MNTGNTGPFLSPFYSPSPGIGNGGTGLGSGTHAFHMHSGDYFWVANPAPFAPWEVVLTVVAAVAMVATVVLIVRRMRIG